MKVRTCVTWPWTSRDDVPLVTLYQLHLFACMSSSSNTSTKYTVNQVLSQWEKYQNHSGTVLSNNLLNVRPPVTTVSRVIMSTTN